MKISTVTRGLKRGIEKLERQRETLLEKAHSVEELIRALQDNLRSVEGIVSRVEKPEERSTVTAELVEPLVLKLLRSSQNGGATKEAVYDRIKNHLQTNRPELTLTGLQPVVSSVLTSNAAIEQAPDGRFQIKEEARQT